MVCSREPPGLFDLVAEIRVKCEQLVSFIIKGDMTRAKETLNDIKKLIREFEKGAD